MINQLPIRSYSATLPREVFQGAVLQTPLLGQGASSHIFLSAHLNTIVIILNGGFEISAVWKMRSIAIAALFILLAALLQPASAECKYFKDKDGFPLGIIPTPKNITVVFTNPNPINYTFLVYIEGEAGTTTSLDCRVKLEIYNESFAMKAELSNYSLETGVGFKERPFVLFMTPANLINFPDEILFYIKITDIDYLKNYALLPVTAKYKFEREKPKPSITATPTPTQGGSGLFPTSTPTPKPFANLSSLTDIITKVEDNNTKYTIAVVAFIFLAGLLWMGFNSMQRD